MPAVFLGHGSPMNALETNRFTQSWRDIGARLPRPRAILCVSAHWVTRGPAVTAMARPRTIHDFGRFPQALFDMRYPAPGDPALASRVRELLGPTPVHLDGDWGLDHGAWSVLVHAFPGADIPVAQLGMDGALDGPGHFRLARRLAPLRDEGVLILGSGNVVHNLPAMNWNDRGGAGFDWARRFDAHIRAAIVADQPDRVAGYKSLGHDAALSVPDPEHFWPLLYVLGVRDEGDEAVIETDVMEYGSLSMMSVVLAPGKAH